MTITWGGKRYHTLNYHLRETFGQKVFKVPLDAGFTCPNRDGTRGRGGCLFCSPHGSGDFAGDRRLSLSEQFQQVRGLLHRKWPQALYIAYFQAFTNTYASVSRLRELYYSVLKEAGVVGISIATRPDCLPDDVLRLLTELNESTYLWVELGMQTVHEGTARAMNLGYSLSDVEDAVRRLKNQGIRVCLHIILGLPGETREMMLETARHVAGMNVQGIKIHLLHVMKNTGLEKMYLEGQFRCLERDEYIKLVADILEILPPEMIVHRVTGDSPREALVAPQWSLKKWEILNDIDRELERRDSWQGKYYRIVSRS